MKAKVGQLQAQIETVEAERKRIVEAFEREVSQRCTYYLLFRPKILLTTAFPVNAIASIAEGMPAHLENLLSRLEKKCKEQEKETPDLEKSVAALLKLQMN